MGLISPAWHGLPGAVLLVILSDNDLEAQCIQMIELPYRYNACLQERNSVAKGICNMASNARKGIIAVLRLLFGPVPSTITPLAFYKSSFELPPKVTVASKQTIFLLSSV